MQKMSLLRHLLATELFFIQFDLINLIYKLFKFVFFLIQINNFKFHLLLEFMVSIN